jgi:Flp pilus assembly pilin Flp
MEAVLITSKRFDRFSGTYRLQNVLRRTTHATFNQGEKQMDLIARIFVRLRESKRGQTMAEYAFIVSAVAVVVFVSYQVMGQDLNGLVNRLGSDIATTAA